jgi:hypothetical protein
MAQVEGSGAAAMPPRTKTPSSSSVRSMLGPKEEPRLMMLLSLTSPRIRSPRKLKSNVELPPGPRIAVPKIVSSGPSRAAATLFALPIRVVA